MQSLNEQRIPYRVGRTTRPLKRDHARSQGPQVDFDVLAARSQANLWHFFGWPLASLHA
jgi:hypothetical protein